MPENSPHGSAAGRTPGRALFRLGLVRLLSAAILLAGCAAPINYTLPDGPRYTGCGNDTTVTWHPRIGQRESDPPPATDTTSQNLSSPEIRIVSFNIKFAVEIDRAISLLGSQANLRSADVLLLQEMDEPGVRRIAGLFGHCWVYYPATLHPQSERQFGDAILSRYPIVEDHKVNLPHLGRFGRTQRIAAAATLDVHGRMVRVYSLHLATIVELGPDKRADQARAVVADAARFDGPVIVGGDLNARALGEVFAGAGYDWITRDLGPTTRLASLDHFLVRGMSASAGSVGKITDARGASDHVPIWAVLSVTDAATGNSGAVDR